MRKLNKLEIVGLVLAIGLAVAGPVAAALLFTHTAPTVTVPSVVGTSCSTLYEWTQSLAQNTSGYAVFTCRGASAFLGGKGGSANYVVTLGGWSQLFVYQNSTQPGASCSGATALSASGSFAFAASSAYNYCAAIVTAGSSISGFNVQWSLP